jgi:hypothetical protein
MTPKRNAVGSLASKNTWLHMAATLDSETATKVRTFRIAALIGELDGRSPRIIFPFVE